MLLKSKSNGRFELLASESELILLSNALNEVCNGIHFGDGEFATRLGASREEAQRLLGSLAGALKGIGPART